MVIQGQTPLETPGGCAFDAGCSRGAAPGSRTVRRRAERIHHKSERTSRTAAGFTLLELLVAITLLSLMSLVVFSALRVANKAWESGDLRAQESYEMRLTQNLLRSQLSGAMPVFVEEDGEARLLFSGDSSTVEFVVEMEPPIGLGGIYQLRIEPAENDPHTLVLVGSLLTPTEDVDIDDVQEVFRSVLAEGVSNLEFGYYGAEDEPDAEPRWRESWEQQAVLPELVRLDIDREGGETWPALVVALEVTGKRYFRDLPFDSDTIDEEDADAEGLGAEPGGGAEGAETQIGEPYDSDDDFNLGESDDSA